MATNIRRIVCKNADAAGQIAALRQRLSPQGDMVSPRGRELTERVFGESLPPLRVVERICAEVRSRGRDALIHYTEQLDRVRLTPETVRVPARELAAARAAAKPEFLETIRRVRQNVMSFQLGVLHRDAVLSMAGSHELRLRYRPMRRVGICIPGGAAAYPSTLLMTVCPAQAAGVKELAVVMPPTEFGANNQEMLAVCQELGVGEVYRVGGAQAVAALAYGVEGLPAVDMIVGPGNLFVTLAKRHVYGQVAIDMLAGPTEVVVVADKTARPDYVAADLISQAEHSPGASILVTWHEPLLAAVEGALDKQLSALPRGDLARESLAAFGAFVVAGDEIEGLACANQIAPEHLHLAVADPESMVSQVENAGAIFLGHYSPVAVGDYLAGPSHVLPTGGTARFASGLSANDFLRRSSVISFTRPGLESIADDLRLMAEKEGLTGHSASVDIRLEDPKPKDRNPRREVRNSDKNPVAQRS
jgi:histidinol dehydrogenase